MRLWLSVVLTLLSLSCETPPDPRLTNFKIEKPGATIQYDAKTGRLRKIDLDLDKNGRFETFSYWDGTRLDRIEIDQDEDGKIDRWEHYAPGDIKRVTRVGESSRNDGVEDMWTYPNAAGELDRVEKDSDRDGTADVREIFTLSPTGTRVITTVELDFDTAGRPKRRLHYKPDGSFDRVENIKN